MALLTFRLNYHTTWGQQVCLCGSVPELGQFDESNALVLSNEGDDWFAEVKVTKRLISTTIILSGNGGTRFAASGEQTANCMSSGVKRNISFRISGKVSLITHISIHLFSPKVFSGTKRSLFLQDIIPSLWY